MRLVILVAILCLTSAPVCAGLTVCNKTGRTLIVADGRYNGVHWVSEGWTTLRADKCSELIQGPLTARFYYLFASDGVFKMWNGDKKFCVSAIGSFSDTVRGACESRGLSQRGFREIDTGAHLDWTYTISNAE
jgi:uncharacterized membrane protein